jgi:ADP-ribose pyrophosphatase YjhB (NUDIX family)
MTANTQSSLYQIADELRAIASQGLIFTEGAYDKERYEKILHASARIVAVLEDAAADEVYTRFHENLFHVSPVVTVEAAVIREKQILLIQRRDNGLWCLPGGLVEVGETPAESAERELWEESGIHGHAARLLGIFDSRRWYTKTRMQLYHLLFEVESDEIPTLHSRSGESHESFHETLDVGFFFEDNLPPLHPGHDRRVPLLFQMLRSEVPLPYFDRERI